MAMLAEPRRKQKIINLRAKNNAWSNDSGKFGQRMLEKMGWSSGKGLGAKENGNVEHVVARYKNDNTGLGFEDRNDQWTKHEDDFNAVLANLSSGSANEEQLHSGISLEDKSKKSKARIHYHKFTRGKDLSQYSEKDLANIFGKKSFKQEDLKEMSKEDVKTTEQVFIEKGNMEEYFKNKLAAIKTKIMVWYENYENEEYAFHGYSSATHEEENGSSHFGFGFFPLYFYNTNANYQTGKNGKDQPKNTKTNKKKMKNKQENNCKINSDQSSLNGEQGVNEDTITKKAKKFKKKKVGVISQEQIIEIVQVKERKKKTKVKLDSVQTVETEDIVEEDIHVPKKKKKSKNKDVEN